jgi:hypothetical protein
MSPTVLVEAWTRATLINSFAGLGALLTLRWKIWLKHTAATTAEKKGSSALTMCVKLTAALAAGHKERRAFKSQHVTDANGMEA